MLGFFGRASFDAASKENFGAFMKKFEIVQEILYYSKTFIRVIPLATIVVSTKLKTRSLFLLS